MPPPVPTARITPPVSPFSAQIWFRVFPRGRRKPGSATSNASLMAFDTFCQAKLVDFASIPNLERPYFAEISGFARLRPIRATPQRYSSSRRCVLVATTQVPEMTAAIQSFLNAGFRSAAQVEFVVMIGDKSLHPVTKAVRFQSFRNFVPKHAFTRYCW